MVYCYSDVCSLNTISIVDTQLRYKVKVKKEWMELNNDRTNHMAMHAPVKIDVNDKDLELFMFERQLY